MIVNICASRLQVRPTTSRSSRAPPRSSAWSSAAPSPGWTCA